MSLAKPMNRAVTQHVFFQKRLSHLTWQKRCGSLLWLKVMIPNQKGSCERGIYELSCMNILLPQKSSLLRTTNVGRTQSGPRMAAHMEGSGKIRCQSPGSPCL